MGCHDEITSAKLLPQNRGCQVNRIQSAQRSRKRLRCTRQNERCRLDNFELFNQPIHCLASVSDGVVGELVRQAHTVQCTQTLNLYETTNHSGLD